MGNIMEAMMFYNPRFTQKLFFKLMDYKMEAVMLYNPRLTQKFLIKMNEEFCNLEQVEYAFHEFNSVKTVSKSLKLYIYGE